jgi:hypothetical protein
MEEARIGHSLVESPAIEQKRNADIGARQDIIPNIVNN